MLTTLLLDFSSSSTTGCSCWLPSILIKSIWNQITIDSGIYFKTVAIWQDSCFVGIPCIRMSIQSAVLLWHCKCPFATNQWLQWIVNRECESLAVSGNGNHHHHIHILILILIAIIIATHCSHSHPASCHSQKSLINTFTRCIHPRFESTGNVEAPIINEFVKAKSNLQVPFHFAFLIYFNTD
jgi:hypothetical protein